MTTIAFDADGMVAWDSQVTLDNIREAALDMKVKVEADWIIGVAGDLSLRDSVVDWFLNGHDREKVPRGSWGMLAWKDGKLWHADSGNITPGEVAIPYAIGTGAVIARTAMRLGKNAREAVGVAVEMDIFSGPPVHSMNVKEALAMAKAKGSKPKGKKGSGGGKKKC